MQTQALCASAAPGSSTARIPLLATLVLGVALAVALWAGVAPPVALADAGGVGVGLIDARIDQPAMLRESTLADVGRDVGELGCDWVRLTVLWHETEPAPGRYDTARLATLDRIVDQVRAQGAQVLLTVFGTPRWASDRRWWRSPPPGRAPGYRTGYAMESTALPRLQQFAGMLAQRYAGRVSAMECWNEPNSWAFLYPQRTAARADYGARTYLRMLRAFSAGVRASGAGIDVIGGATMSVGRNDRYRTSPQRFARYLAANGAAALIDGYSHHPYVPGGTRDLRPASPPARPSYTVTLGNLRTLLRVFPRKPFYLTEYGYNTRPSRDFGWVHVSERTQAGYLTQAYAVAARYPQVRALFWFLNRDLRPRGLPADHGVYTGLCRPDGTRKPSWSAFKAL